MKTILPLAAVGLFLLPSWAEEEPVELPDIELSIQRYRQPKEDITAQVSVVDQEDIQAAPGENLRDLLLGVPGLDIRPQGAAGAQAGVSLRGSRTEQILVLLDGRRLNNAQGGGFDFSDLSLYDLERVEILRGGGSALYGSDPVGGVINLVTRRGGSGRFETRFATGSFDTTELSLGTGARSGRVDYRLDLDRFLQGGDFSYEDNAGGRVHRANNGLHRTDLRGSAAYDLGRWGELSWGGGLFHAVKGVPGRLEFPSPDATQRDVRFDAHVAHRVELNRGVELHSQAYWQQQERDYEDKTGAFPVDANHRNELFSGELLATVQVAGQGRAVTGLDYRGERVNSTNDGRHHRTTGGLFGLYEVDLGAVTLVPSLRLDGQTGEGPIFSPRFGVVGRAARAVTLRANAGRSFRAPSFDDLFWPEDAFSKGNPNLRPEHSTDWDLGVEWRPSARTTLSVDYFNRDAADQIVWLPGAGSKWSPQNLGRVRFQGLEAEFETPLHLVRGLSLRGGYYWLKATTHSGTAAEVGKQLVGHPFHQGSVGVRYADDRWLADLRLRAVDDRFTTAANTQTLPSYAVADATVRWRTGGWSELRLELRNLLNTSYRTVLDYPLPGFEMRLSAARQF